MKRIFWIFMAMGLSLFAGCGGGSNPQPTPVGILYVLDHFNKAVYIFSNLDTINGNIDPVRTITGDQTLIGDPSAISVDVRRDILYVADSLNDLILAFIPASSNDGNVAPRRTFPGPVKTGQMYYDQDNDSLYVVDLDANGIQVWDDIKDQTTGTPPQRKIKLGYTPSGIFVDGKRNILYVGDPGATVVNAYNDAATLSTGINNNAVVSREITDSTLPFVNINSLSMNVPNDFLYVTESQNPSIEIFRDASLIATPTPTDRSLSGSNTGMGIDTSIVEFDENVLYLILSRTNIGIWNNANTVTGNVAPDRNVHLNPATETVDFAIDLSR